jgi:lipopolysaccharide export system permease protein
MKRAAVNIGGLVVFACCVLLLERLLHIFEIISNSSDSAADAARMIYNLLPHYLGIAVPMALMVGTIITIDRFSKSSELTAALGAGVSLFHVTKPFFLLAMFLSVLTVFIEGYMQPVGQYNYQQIVNAVKQRGFTAVLREGTFTTVGTRTFFAGTDLPSDKIGPIFIYESSEDDLGNQIGLRVTTANEGRLVVREDADGNKTGDPILYLSSGRIHQIQNDKQIDGDLDFDSSSIAGAATPISFRERGYDEREFTSLELFKNRHGTEFSTVTKETNNAALHFRAARAILLLLLPFVAVPFGLNYGRNPSSAGIFIGVVFIVSIQKLLEFGQSLGASGIIPPWIGIWPTIGCVAIFAAYIFWRSAFKIGQPPLTSFAQMISHYQLQIRKSLLDFRIKLSRVESV